MRRTLIIRTHTDLSRLRPCWEELCAASAGTLFQSFHWNRLAARVFADRESPCVIFCETDAGAAIVPAVLRAGGAGFLGESLFDYRDVLWAGDRDVLALAMAELAALHRPLHVTSIRDDFRDPWVGLPVELFTCAPRVRAREISADEFAAAHRRLGSRLRRLERAGAALRQHSGADAALVRWIYQEKARHLEGHDDNLFADPRRIAFLVAVAAADPTACDVFTLELPEHPIAALVTFRDGPVRRFYTTYYDPAWGHESPGMALLYEITRRTLAEGLDCDYLTGDQPYKRRFATSYASLYRVNATAEDLADFAVEYAPTTQVRGALLAA